MEWGSGIGISFCCFYYTGSDGLPTGAFTLSFLKKGKKKNPRIWWDLYRHFLEDSGVAL